MAARMTCLKFALAFLAAAASLSAAEPDSAASPVRRDSLLVPDSTFSDYLNRRERFNYPATSRQDPFNLPFRKSDSGVDLGPGLDDIDLTGVLYSPDGLSVAIVNLPSGSSFLLHEGDYFGLAEVNLIERTRIHFRIREYGIIRNFIKDLKPLVEGENGKSPEQAGSGDRQQESQPADESGGAAPRKQ